MYIRTVTSKTKFKHGNILKVQILYEHKDNNKSVINFFLISSIIQTIVTHKDIVRMKLKYKLKFKVQLQVLSAENVPAENVHAPPDIQELCVNVLNL